MQRPKVFVGSQDGAVTVASGTEHGHPSRWLAERPPSNLVGAQSRIGEWSEPAIFYARHSQTCPPPSPAAASAAAQLDFASMLRPVDHFSGHSFLHCSINSFRCLGFLLWFVLGPRGLRKAPGSPGKAHGGLGSDSPGPGSQKPKNQCFLQDAVERPRFRGGGLLPPDL